MKIELSTGNKIHLAPLHVIYIAIYIKIIYNIIKNERQSIYQPIVHISETFAPHLFSNIEKYLNFQQKLVNSPPADLGNSSDLIILTSSSWE